MRSRFFRKIAEGIQDIGYAIEDATRWIDNAAEWIERHKRATIGGILTVGVLCGGLIVNDGIQTSKQIARLYQGDVSTSTALLKQGKIADAYGVARRALYEMATKRRAHDLCVLSREYTRTADTLTTITDNCQAEARKQGIELTFWVNN